jgi:hypothetical protein
MDPFDSFLECEDCDQNAPHGENTEQEMDVGEPSTE